MSPSAPVLDAGAPARVAGGDANRSSLRALEVFEAFRQARRPLSLSELSRLTAMPVSTCHGVMHTLAQRGYLYFVSGRDAYPTRRLMDLAADISAHDPIGMRAQPVLAQLRDLTDETVILGSRQGDEVLYLLVLESRQSIRYSSRAGERKPLHSSAVGKVILGTLDEETFARWLRAHPLARVTDRTLTSQRALRADLAASRARGWYATRGENVTDVMAIAMPLRIGHSELGVAIAGPIHRMQPAEARLAKKLAQTVRALETDDAR